MDGKMTPSSIEQCQQSGGKAERKSNSSRLQIDNQVKQDNCM